MANFSTTQIFGIIVLIALVLLYVPIPLIEGKTIAALLLLASGLYLLVFGK